MKPQNLSAISFGYTSAVGFFVFFGLGYWLDRKFATGYVWTLAGIFIGFVLLIYEVWKILRNINNKDKN